MTRPRSTKKTITVLFTDIIGFTALAEQQPPEAVATLLNAHFKLVAGAIDAEQGIIDKFIGDSVMSFWEDDTPDAACRAALSIARLIDADNKKRAQQKQNALSLCISVHTGEAIIGPIAPSHYNSSHTIVGDTVNIGQRMLSLHQKLFKHPTETTILISDITHNHLKTPCSSRFMGTHPLKGRRGKIGVYQLGG